MMLLGSFPLSDGNALLSQLLTVNPEHRFSCLADVQASAYLSGVAWSDVCGKRVEPGFVPNVSRGQPPRPRAGRCSFSRGFLTGSCCPRLLREGPCGASRAAPCLCPAEGPPALRPHLRAGGDDPGVQALAQEEEEAGEEQVEG